MKYRSCKDCPQYEKCVTTSNLAIKRKRCEFADNSRNEKPLTHFDRIKAMSVEEMAEYIYAHDDDLNDVICKTMHKHCPFGDNVTPENCMSCVKKWLESEVQGE